jgi:hypothetical protein
MLRNDAPLLFRPQLDWQQWRWGLKFLAQCSDRGLRAQRAPARGPGRLQPRRAEGRRARHRHRVPPARARHRALLHRPRGAGGRRAGRGADAAVRRRAPRRLARRAAGHRARVPPFAHRIVGGTYTASDESGDARVFTRALAAARCAERGVRFLFGHTVQRIEATGGAAHGVRARRRQVGEAPAGGRCHRGGLRLLDRAVAARRGRRPADLSRQGLQRHLPAAAPRGGAAGEHHRRRGEVRDDAAGRRACAWPAPSSWPGWTPRWPRARPAPAAACWPNASSWCCPACATRARRPRAAIRAGGPACARDADQHPLHRPHPHRAPVGERRPRHAGLDPRRGVGQGAGRVDQRRAAGVAIDSWSDPVALRGSRICWLSSMFGEW